MDRDKIVAFCKLIMILGVDRCGCICGWPRQDRGDLAEIQMIVEKARREIPEFNFTDKDIDDGWDKSRQCLSLFSLFRSKLGLRNLWFYNFGHENLQIELLEESGLEAALTMVSILVPQGIPVLIKPKKPEKEEPVSSSPVKWGSVRLT